MTFLFVSGWASLKSRLSIYDASPIDIYVLDYRKVQDAIFLKVFTFDIFCKL